MLPKGHTSALPGPWNRSGASRSRMNPAVQVGPFARLNEAGPVEGMLAVFAFQHGEFGLAQGLTAPLAPFQSFVVRGHHFLCNPVTDWPQTHHQRFSAG